MKNFSFLISLIVFNAIIFSSCNNKNQLQLVSNGVSNYEIVIKSDASSDIKNASGVLQKYFQIISTAKIPIVTEEHQSINKKKIVVQVQNINKNQLKISTENSNIFIVGGSDSAVQNAVYEFLESYLKCKWYSPTAEEIPTSKNIVLSNTINYSYTPNITTRTVHSKLFYENPEFAAKHKVTTNAFPYYVPSARVHTFNKFIPEEVFYKTNPEYYALRGTKRLPTQLCLTNNEVYEIVKDSVASLFRQYPDANVISVSQNDNQQYCTCEKCKIIDETERSSSGTMIQFVNKIAANFPDKTISTLAYQYTRKPSKTKPLSNVLITLCSIECDRSAPIEENCIDFSEDLKGWKQITENIRIWDYTTQFTNFLAPFPNLHTLQPNIQLFSENNATWVFEQHSHNPSELFELRSYITAKLLWNPSLNIDELITEFTNGYYKESGVYVKKYIDLVHEKIQEDNDFFLFLYGDPSQAFNSFLKPALLKQYNSFFNEAEKAASSPEVLNRVKCARISVDYAILEACKKGISEDFQLVISDKNGTKSINPVVNQKLINFYETCKKNNITLMNEMGFTVEEYFNNYKKSLEVASQPNKAFAKKVTLLTKPKKYANENPQTLTDGALGGSNFYANWLGFEGANLEAIIDLEAVTEISSVSTAFLQVSNHIVFFPVKVSYYYSNDNQKFEKLGVLKNDTPLTKTSKINDIKYFNLEFSKVKARYIKIIAENMNKAPYWHHAADLPSWIFADEVIIN
ncbi:DUF4838 domain-containing protein [Lutibacter maritimus]|uniref:F5/8 type C domain-containing protein n=1 Tax=Lutibacter maritimus TaxID=593133 RepID=A0A1I6RDF0_9FLAO|nr:DUF4838 domain-containing protein [Lutibacter maritimus]SFS62757.1 F5/8 type C domain-containing protein [Lutibacter maritimus]